MTGQNATSSTVSADAPVPVRVGIGGWNYADWRASFYPDGLPQARELAYASRRLNSLEINSTYYSSQSPATFAKWRDETPEGFQFSLKASRFATNRRVLAEAGESVQRFVNSGIAELGEKLGPIVWQFAPTKKFDPDDFGAFLALLPGQVAGLRLRHVVDVRHESFKDPAYLALARRHQVATVFSDSDEYPCFADLTGGLVYARLMKTESVHPLGYAPARLDDWAAVARDWVEGRDPASLPHVEATSPDLAGGREAYVYFISGAKERAPAAAQALMQRLGWRPLVEHDPKAV